VTENETITLKIYTDEQIKALRREVIILNAGVKAAAEVALAANDRRLDAMNEFRGMLADQSRNMVPRTEYSVQHKALEDRINEIYKRQMDIQNLLTDTRSTMAGRQQGMATFSGVIYSIIIASGACIGIWLGIMPHVGR
jgi:hypothetical protein